MTDKKLTDSEIIEALECCGDPYDICANCPIPNAIKDDCRCGEHLANNALDLINRQQAEIERLKGRVNLLEAEIYAPIKAKARAEAVKEFAEKSKKVWWDNGYESPDVDFDDFVDNLVKEMVGDNNA